MIINAAHQQFSRYGFFKVTMDEIAEQAGMGKASLYYYFPTKERLFEAVVLNEQRKFLDCVEMIVKKNITASEKLRQYVQLRFEYFNKIVTLNVSEVRSSTKMKPILRKLFDIVSAQELEVINGFIREGKKLGEFHIRSAEVAARVFQHALHGLRILYRRRMEDVDEAERNFEPLREEMTELAEVYLRGISRAN
ncbi:MAG TPA: helix-turn-helix domain-containing protein [Bacteroidota bacterium]|nr:helix-turn-helix domain-containing protein [Bacteroidota bacterium]